MLKYCAVLSLCAGLGLSADFVTGQGARLVIGQTTFTSQTSGASDTILGSAGGLAFANNTLFVADANRLGFAPINNRVLIYTNVSQTLPQPTAQLEENSRCPVCGGTASLVLGQPDFTTTTPARTQSGMNLPLAVASDGKIVAVADTSNNRVLIWNSIPTQNGQPADLVLGQADFTTIGPVVVTASTFRAPQGVWIQGNRLFVADTQNNRVLIWNSIPTKNNQPADVVLGAPNFTTIPQIDQTKISAAASANIMLTPISVSSDGTHVFVTDLGFSRVLIWNSIPTQNGQAADVVIGQPDMTSATPNNAFTGIAATSSSDTTNKETPVLCTTATGTDPANNPTYPQRCAATLNFPRFTIPGGGRLFIADGGNDRVLVFNQIPTQNGASADVVLGEPDEFSDVVTSTSGLFTPNLTQSAADVTPTPTSLAWDGTNLYVTDPANYRVLVFTPAEPDLHPQSVVNAASLNIYAIGTVALGGTAGNAGDTVTVTIQGTAYSYKENDKDTFDIVLTQLANAINGANNGAGDPNVLAKPLLGFNQLQLVSRLPGEQGNAITVAASVSQNAQITATTAATLSGGNTPSTIAPGTIIAIMGQNLADQTVGTDPNAQSLPTTLGGVQVYIDGIRSPLLSVSPTQINAQVSWSVLDTNSSNLYVRIQHADGSVTVTNAIGMKVVQANPGIFAASGTDPRPAYAYHASSYATGTIAVDGTITAGDVASVSIEDRTYNYTVQSGDTLGSVRDALIAAINANDPKVSASPAGAFTRIRLQARVPGPDGNGIQYSATSTPASGSGQGSVVLTALNSQLCCANRADAPVTNDNPAIAGETIYVLATGLGLVCDINIQCQGGRDSDPALAGTNDGQAYTGPALNNPQTAVSSLAGGHTATVISAGLMPGAIGIYKVVLELDAGLSSNPNTQLTISQDIYTSNIVVFPLIQPTPSQ